MVRSARGRGRFRTGRQRGETDDPIGRRPRAGSSPVGRPYGSGDAGHVTFLRTSHRFTVNLTDKLGVQCHAKILCHQPSISNLQRVVNTRDHRIALAKGGYYFVDMNKYLDYYLGTTDASEMPEKAVVGSSQTDVFQGFLCHPSIKRIVVCVHGYNVELYEAATWFRIFTDTVRNLEEEDQHIVTSPDELPDAGQHEQAALTAFVGFSWPSNGRTLHYHSDQVEAVGSASALGTLLARLRATQKSVNLLCHSMGALLACHTLASLIRWPDATASCRWE